MKFTIRQLEIFKEVAISGHVSNSSDILGISQSAISMSIQELEGNLGVKLFERRNRKLILNETGRVLLEKAESLLQGFKGLEHIFLENNVSGNLVIGGSMTIGDYLLPFIIYNFMKLYPECKLELTVLNTQEIVHKLLVGEIDVAFIEGVCDSQKFDTSYWFKDELIVVASDKKEFSKKKYRIEELYEKKWILRETGSGTREIFKQFLGNHFSKLNIFMTLGHTEAIKRIVSNSEGLCCLSRLAVQKELDEGTLFEITIEGMRFERELLQLIYKEKYQSLLLREFVKFASVFVRENMGK